MGWRWVKSAWTFVPAIPTISANRQSHPVSHSPIASGGSVPSERLTAELSQGPNAGPAPGRPDGPGPGRRARGDRARPGDGEDDEGDSCRRTPTCVVGECHGPGPVPGPQRGKPTGKRRGGGPPGRRRGPTTRGGRPACGDWSRVGAGSAPTGPRRWGSAAPTRSTPARTSTTAGAGPWAAAAGSPSRSATLVTRPRASAPASSGADCAAAAAADWQMRALPGLRDHRQGDGARGREFGPRQRRDLRPRQRPPRAAGPASRRPRSSAPLPVMSARITGSTRG